VSYEGSPVPPGARADPFGRAAPTAPHPAVAPPSHLRRLVAFLVDGVVVLALGVLVLAVALSGVASDDPTIVERVLVGLLAYAVAATLFAPVCMALLGGRTLGKALVGLRVVREDGSPCSFGRALVREVLVKGLVLGAASAITGGLAFLADAIWPLIDDRRRALHDLVSGTRVVSG
jgi:uncharacterized RDD family membrane protein YckC